MPNVTDWDQQAFSGYRKMSPISRPGTTIDDVVGMIAKQAYHTMVGLYFRLEQTPVTKQINLAYRILADYQS